MNSLHSCNTKHWLSRLKRLSPDFIAPLIFFSLFSLSLLQPLFAQDSHEPDDTWAQAKTISPGVPHTGHSIDPTTDVDWVTFVLTGTSDIVLDTSGASGDTRLWLYDHTLSVIGYDNNGGGGNFSQISQRVDAGTYYAKIDEYGNNEIISDYTVILSVTPILPDSYETDDTWSQASTISPGVDQEHNIFPETDEDWVIFVLSQSSWVVLETSGPSGDTRMWLYDGTVTEIAYDDDGGTDYFSALSLFLEAGTYYVKIDEFGNDDLLLSYFISLSVTPCSLDAYEPDNSCGQANTILPGVAQSAHSIDPAWDEDWVTFILDEASGVVVETSGPSGDTVMTLYDEALDEVANDDNGGTGNFSRLSLLLEEGTYCVQVTGSDVISSYTITLSSCSLYPDIYEADDTWDQANTIIFDQLQPFHTFYPEGDTDWLQFTVAESGGIKMYYSIIGDPMLHIILVEFYDSSLEQIGYSYIYGFVPYFGTYYGVLDVGIYLDPGTYYAKISEFEGVDAYDVGITESEEVDQYELDDTWDQATSLTIGLAQTGHICYENETPPARDYDWVVFRLDTESSLTLEATGSGYDMYIGLYDDTDFINPIAAGGPTGGGDLATIATTLEAGTYYARLQPGWDYGLRSYTITLSATSILDDAYEPDNSPGQASSISPGIPQPNHSLTVNDEDWVTFTLTEGSLVTIDTGAEMHSPSIYLYDEDVRFRQAAVGSNGPDLEVGLPAGTYYAQIIPYDIMVPDYTITLSSVPATLDAYEPDNIPDAATSITLGATQANHSISPLGDLDYVSIQLDEPTAVVIETSGVSGDTYLELYQDYGGSLYLVFEDDNGGVDNFSRMEILLRTVPYYAVVRETGNDAVIDSYSISLSQLDPGLLDTYEPDNTLEQATSIALDETQENHSLYPHLDMDWVSFVLAEDRWVVLETLGSGTTPLLTIYDESLHYIAGSSDHYYLSLTAGTYYASTSESWDGLIDNYAISLSSAAPPTPIPTPTPGDIYEVDDTPASATLLTFGAPQEHHSLIPLEDEDWVKFVLAEDAYVVLQTSGTSGDTMLKLYEEGDTSNPIEDDDDSGEGNFSCIRTVLHRGSYYAQVTKGSLQTTELDDYTISLEKVNILKSQPLQQYGLGMLTCMTYSPDGKTLLTAGARGAYLWNAQTGQLIRRFVGHRGEVRAVAFSPDGTWIATAGIDGTVKIWDVSSGVEVRTLYVGNTFSLAISPDRTKMLTTGHGGGCNPLGLCSSCGLYRLWDIQSGELLRDDAECATYSIGGTSIYVTCTFVDFLPPDGTRIVSGYTRCSFSHYGGGCSSYVRVTDTDTGAEILQGGSGPYAAISPDGTQLLTSEGELWDIDTGVKIAQFEQEGAVDFRPPDGDQILIDGWLYNVNQPGAKLYQLPGQLFSPDGSAVLGQSGSMVKLWNADTGDELLSFIGHTEEAAAVAVSADETKAWTLNASLPRVWDASSGVFQQTYSDFNIEEPVVFYPDNAWLVATSETGDDAVLIDLDSGTVLRTFHHGDYMYIGRLAISSDGSRLLTSSSSVAKIWNTTTGVEIQTITAAATSAAFFPDGTKVALGNASGEVSIYNVSTGALISTFSIHDQPVRAIEVFDDGNKIASGDGYDWSGATVKLWNATTGTVLWSHSAFTDWVTCIAVSADESSVAAGEENGSVRIWLTETGEETDVFWGHDSPVSSVGFSADGTRVMSSSEDGASLLWELNPPRAIIVAGGGAGTDNPIAQQTDELGAYAYKTLKRRGYTPSDILYLSAFAPRDVDEDGLIDVDGPATIENLEDAIAGEFGSGAGRLLILMMDHGFPAGSTPRLSEPAFTAIQTIGSPSAAARELYARQGATADGPITSLPQIEFTRDTPQGWSWSTTFNAPLDPGTYMVALYASYPGIPYVVFKMNETETLPTLTLDNWLDQLQSSSAVDVSVVVDACYSGKFVEDCQGAPAGRDRIVISSTSSEAEAVFMPWPDLTSFMFHFLGSVYMGNSMGTAWNAAELFFEQFTVADQVPQINDGTGGTARADREFFGATWMYGVQSTEDVNSFFPAFAAWTADTSVSPGSPVTLWTQMEEGQDPLQVVAVVRPPAPEVVSGEPVTDLPHLYLQRKSDNPSDPDYRLWETTVSDVFTECGQYVVTFTARFDYERISNPVLTYISVSEGIDPDTIPIRALLAIGDSADPGVASCFEGLGAYAYRVYYDRFQDNTGGHHEDWIEYLTPFLDPGRDDPPSAAAMISYIDTLPAEIGRLYLHLIADSDTPGELQLAPGDSLTASELDTALDNLQSRQSCTLILIVDAPYAGTFLPVCAATGAQQRVVMTGTSAAETALFLEAPILSSFSQKFLAAAYQGCDLYEAFTAGEDFFEVFLTGLINPQLDDNGDGQYTFDGTLAHSLYLGRRYAFAGDDAAALPFILDFTSTQTVACGGPVTLSVELLAGIEPSSVFAQLLAPGLLTGNEVYAADFEGYDDEGWQFTTIPPQSFHTSHWADATHSRDAGAIGFEGPAESTNYFALWHNDGADPGAVEWDGDTLWRALFSVSTSQVDANLMPSVRMRIYLEHQKYHSYVRLYPGEWLDVPQHGFGSTDVSVFLHPPAGVTDTGLNLAFAMIDFTDDPRSGDQTGTVWLDEVRVLAYELAYLSSGWTTQDGWSGSEMATCWTYAGGGGGYQAPGSSSSSSGISMTSSVSNTRHFGAWTINDDERPLLLPDQLYRVIFNMSADNVLAPDIRLRTHSLNQSATTGWRYASYVEIVPGSGEGEAIPPASGRDYYVYFSPPGDYGSNTLMVMAFDLIDIEMAPLWGGTDTLGSVTIEHRQPLK